MPACGLGLRGGLEGEYLGSAALGAVGILTAGRVFHPF